MSYILDKKRIILGTDYYPEQWESTLWEDDLKRMKETGLEVIRVAEFAWSYFEPREGEYTYEFFDRFLDVAEKTGIKVIFCTPTATPPVWLTEKYPECLNADKNGILYRHGARRHYNYSSETYKTFARKIVEAIASHYASRECMIGWQIDNELNCETSEFYSESDTISFRLFLMGKYSTLDVLNSAWGTAFWNQQYTSWDEIYVPRPTPGGKTNPHQILDYKRFISDSACRWVCMQSRIIRKYAKAGDFITTNGLFSDIDYKRMVSESLDFITFDSYPDMAYEVKHYDSSPDAMHDREWSLKLSRVRSVAGPFGIMEQQAGASGSNDSMEAPTPRPGQITLWTMQSIAHGSDYIGYFRWRTSIMGNEIYWHGILDYSGRENRRLKEIQDIHKYTEGMFEIAGSLYKAEAGLIETYDNMMDEELDTWHGMVNEVSTAGIFRAAQHTHTPLDIVNISGMEDVSALSRYKVLFWPHAVMISETEAKLMQDYVENGGTLVFGCRTGYKDGTGKCIMDKLPGAVSGLTGADITEYTLIAPDEGKIRIKWGRRELEAAVFNEEIQPVNGAEVLGRYMDSYYKGVPGLIRRSSGAGQVYYFGGAFTEETAKIFLEELNVANPYGHMLQLPEECELAVREKDGIRYLFILNYRKTPAKIKIKKQMRDLLSGMEAAGNMLIEGYGVRILKMQTY